MSVQKNPNCTEKCTAINCFCFEVSFNTHLARIIVKMLVSTHRWKSTRLLNAITLSVLITVSRIRTGRGWTLRQRCQGLLIHHLLSGWPLRNPLVRPACSFFPPCLLLLTVLAVRRTRWYLSWQQLSDSPINYTEWLTPCPTLILASILPQGSSAIFLVITPSTTTSTHPKFSRMLPQTAMPYDYFFLIDWIVHALQFLAAKMFFSVLHWSQLCQISFGSTWGCIEWRAISGTGCLG